MSQELNQAKENEVKFKKKLKKQKQFLFQFNLIQNKASKELSDLKNKFDESIKSESTSKVTISSLEAEKSDLVQKIYDKEQFIQQLEEKNVKINPKTGLKLILVLYQKTAFDEIENLKNESSSLNQAIKDLQSTIELLKTSNDKRENELGQNLEKVNQNLENVTNELKKEREEKVIFSLNLINEFIQG